MSKWLLFFAPKRLAHHIRNDDSIYGPVIVIGLLRLLNFEMTNTFYDDIPGLKEFKLGVQDIVLGPITPLLLAVMYHNFARIILHTQGSFGRLVRLFYYGSVGLELLAIFSGILFWFFPGNSGLNLTWGVLLYLYGLFVITHLLKENYSIAFHKALMLALLIIPIAIILFLMVFSLWRLID